MDGLCDLEFVSEREIVQRPVVIWSTWTSDDSGIRMSPDAYYQQGVEGWGNSGGICNTGVSDHHEGSFVEAFVSHKCCCRKIRINCSYTYFASLYSPVDSFAPASLHGKLLDKAVTGFISTTASGSGVSAALFKTESAEQVVDLPPNWTLKLYNIYPSVAGFRGIRGASFTEHMSVTCSATILGNCGPAPVLPGF